MNLIILKEQFKMILFKIKMKVKIYSMKKKIKEEVNFWKSFIIQKELFTN